MQFDHEMDLQLIPAVARLSPAGCNCDETWIPLTGSTNSYTCTMKFTFLPIFWDNWQRKGLIQGCPVRFTHVHYRFWKEAQIRHKLCLMVADSQHGSFWLILGYYCKCLMRVKCYSCGRETLLVQGKVVSESICWKVNPFWNYSDQCYITHYQSVSQCYHLKCITLTKRYRMLQYIQVPTCKLALYIFPA